MYRTTEIICICATLILGMILLIINLDAEAEPETYAATAIEYAVAETIAPEAQNCAVAEEKTEVEEPMNADTIEQILEFFWMDYGTYEITAYCGCTYCASGTGYTASGTLATEGRTIGVDPQIIPLGTTVRIEFENGTQREYVAEDTGSAIKGQIIDLYFNSHQDALNFGRQKCQVYVKEMNDERN